MGNNPEPKPTFSPAHLPTRFASGFTLLELVVVLTIIGFLVMIMTGVYSGEDDQKRFEQTREQMEEIRKALLGSDGTYASGQRRFAGYIADMGGLPALVDVLGTPGDTSDDQPEGLWDQGGLPDWEHKAASRTWMGWRGAYIEAPPGNVLKDGWGNPLVFSVANGDMTIKSYGADGAEDTGGETGFDEDITLIINNTEYLAPVAGRVTGFAPGNEANIRVLLYIASDGSEVALTMDVGVPSDGYFRFEPRDPAEPDPEPAGSGRKYASIPTGIRSIYAFDVTSPPASPSPMVFTVESTGNWIGEIEIQ
ncbi:MAG: type II secretion system protein GspG [Deltaproteobacteria bacterium]|nr:type II secretion system protein GspG [Deltaproteobacteria bacterium]MBW2075547.1 type II secretion system protein GspG [Deltaproteobacteria bacterium]